VLPEAGYFCNFMPMIRLKRYRFCAILFLFAFFYDTAGTNAQCRMPKEFGINDTILTQAVCYQDTLIPFKEMETVWVSKMNSQDLAKYISEWTRLKNAVYVTYPYARIAGNTINNINRNLLGVDSKKERKKYIKTREKELKKQFGDPLENLSVYQGKVLMKLISRQTGNNCYDIIKEYKGGVNARMYQTVAFFFGSSLKQDWDLKDKTDRQIETFVNEYERSGYNYQPAPASGVAGQKTHGSK
jgi:hypothetical protein